MINDWFPGKEITLHYPTQTHVARVQRCARKKRHIAVRDIRDLVRQPLTPDEFRQRPYILRSRWLIRAVDITGTKLKHRQFYIGSSDEFQSPGVLRFGVFDAKTMDLTRIRGRQFGPTVLDRKEMLRAMPALIKELSTGETLGIFAPDMQVRE